MLEQLQLHSWILETFNKEGLAIFTIICVSFFMTASIFAFWALRNGEFQDLEKTKYEMMDL